MPIFEFQCEECGEIFEELLFSSNFENIKCKRCKSSKVHKLISQVAYKSEGKFVSSSGSGCSSCKGGTCSSCH
ncbi:MAG: FmdB family zinc ribbon protein [Caldimicrobium sp.]|jgi:putative FmdB family regulatory protein|uniref:FmdB family transcriptional regulator n=1 Tax=Caldimicrobium thiodismutans TaxID=1653476 RepID=A0A2N7PIX2_9BACT|nr:MAG: FmdB family transcriptional regulator [Caldimicrobium thiodismutans]